MTRQEREKNPAETFDGGYHLMAKQMHAERVAKTPERIEYAIRQLEANNIEYVVKNASNGHFHCRRKSDDTLVQFWAGTGKILGYGNLRGIHALIDLLNK